MASSGRMCTSRWFIVTCSLAAGLLAGCGKSGKDVGWSPNASDTTVCDTTILDSASPDTGVHTTVHTAANCELYRHRTSGCNWSGSCEHAYHCAMYAGQIDAGIPYTCKNFDDTGVGECVEKPPCQGDDDCHEDEICDRRDDGRSTCVGGCRCDDGGDCDRECGLTRPVCNDDNRCVHGCQCDADCNNGAHFVDNICQTE